VPDRLPKSVYITLGILLAAGVSTGGYFAFRSFLDHRRAEDARAIWSTTVLAKVAFLGENMEYWVGDVAGLYALAHIPRELAEADTAAIHPLVARPKPFHGYYVRAMESAPSFDGPETVSLKGHTKFKGTCAFCIYPAEKGRPDLYVWIVFPGGIYRKASENNEPILTWPKGGARPIGWEMVD